MRLSIAEGNCDAAKVIGSREQAEDIVQEAWLTLQNQRGATDVRDPIGFMRRLVRNLAIDKLRLRMRENRLLCADMEGAVPAMPPPQDTPPCPC